VKTDDDPGVGNYGWKDLRALAGPVAAGGGDVSCDRTVD
jgi:hypothetical protein